MGWQIPICQKERSPLQSFKKSMPDGICRIGVRQPIFFCRIGVRYWVGKFRFAKKNAVLYSPLKKVCLAAFAESEFGNPFAKVADL